MSVLRPRMFIMYMADMAELTDEQRVHLHSYADDSQIYVHCPTPRGMNFRSLPLYVRKSSEAKHG